MGEGIGEQEMEELVPEWHRRNVFAETAVCVCVCVEVQNENTTDTVTELRAS